MKALSVHIQTARGVVAPHQVMRPGRADPNGGGRRVVVFACRPVPGGSCVAGSLLGSLGVVGGVVISRR